MREANNRNADAAELTPLERAEARAITATRAMIQAQSTMLKMLSDQTDREDEALGARIRARLDAEAGAGAEQRKGEDGAEVVSLTRGGPVPTTDAAA